MEDLTPLYNKEFYLAHLCGEDVVLPIPDGNAERYLAYLCGMDVTIPDVPDGRTETYLAYKCGEDVVLPDPMYRIEFYLAKWCGIDCEVPEPLYRIEYWLAQLANSGELKTVTGNPISVSDALAKPAESLTIEILPYQSGSGDPSPDNVRPITGWTGVNIPRTGKNMLDESTKSVDNSGKRFRWYLTDGLLLKANQTYTFSVTGSEQLITLYFMDFLTATSLISASSTVKYTPTTDKLVYLQAYRGTVIEDTNVFMLNLGNNAEAYEPYTGTTYSIDWTDEAGTVYGGELDVTTGVLKVTHELVTIEQSDISSMAKELEMWRITLSSLKYSQNYKNGICDKFKVVTSYGAVRGSNNSIAFNQSGGGQILLRCDSATTSEEVRALFPASVYYPLATPLVIQLTPTQVDMLLGNNTIWNDVGDMVLEYLADGPADDIDALNILLNNRYVNNGAEDEATDKEALEILLGGNTR